MTDRLTKLIDNLNGNLLEEVLAAGLNSLLADDDVVTTTRQTIAQVNEEWAQTAHEAERIGYNDGREDERERIFSILKSAQSRCGKGHCNCLNPDTFEAVFADKTCDECGEIHDEPEDTAMTVKEPAYISGRHAMAHSKIGEEMERMRIIKLLTNLNVIRRDALGHLVAFDTHGENVIYLTGLEK